MTTPSVSSSRPADAGFAAAATLVAAVVFLFGWAILHRGFFADRPIVDTPVYERYGSAIDSGYVPYRDIAVEYPPGALPVFVAPALGGARGDTYRRRFEGLMAFLGVVTLFSVGLALVSLGAGRRWLLAALGLAAVAPILLGPVVLSRFDLWPAALTAIALAALVGDRFRWGHVALGAAVAAKLYAAVLVPVALIYVWRRRGRRDALICGGLLLAVVAIAFVPFLVVAPHGIWDSLWNQASRPLQIESLGAGLLLVSHHVFGTGVTMESGHGSQNLAGTTADTFAVVQSLLQISALAAIWILFARGPATKTRLLYASAAALVAFIALGKVLSPQFLIWLIPIVPLLRGRRGLTAAVVLVAALVLTQLWFPYRYWDLALHFGTLESWLVLLRDVALLVLLWVVVRGLVERDSEGLTARRPA
jgi:uncharacterized membrane protein